MSITYLTIDEVIALHDYAIRRFGGAGGLADRGKLEASIAAPIQNVFGTELYPDLWSKAAVLFFLLIKNHPFTDGNKRTALYALLRFLEVNGFTISGISNDELYQFTIDVASSLLNQDKIVEWLKTHTVSMPQPG
ncbi:MAG: type II toxin-antitoxin system death-on-curing family toxin [candidate division KSB1 bacterium]|nr:type II toxin-antitoxin system death-on-curing family toxin [candidate division KSB1 bacterium]MDZ7276268.1 type II toxin-antitoxin system death-on-curing family toxin [candidate division KSB1 bacterium]MDZ7287926.1 type II toxin-antitoxin system death-on-curing family toxin [candidate division KSB1 bacterium]MDZ7300061.1 type II toxin-antitoxin system death-on-curing family toxin [candidate division KSB1 bacterium]MDZ7307303.1 type II toxin-antitoxin system death-on-curing family toxin [can